MSLTGNNFSLIWQKILTAVPGPAFHKLLIRDDERHQSVPRINLPIVKIS